MSCSICKHVETECGDISEKVHLNPAILPLCMCKRNIDGHLRTVGLPDAISEADLLLPRIGIFEYEDEVLARYTVCPKHQYRLGGGWYKRFCCRFPEHSGKQKPDSRIGKKNCRSGLKKNMEKLFQWDQVRYSRLESSIVYWEGGAVY